MAEQQRFAVRHHDGAVTRHLPNPAAAIADGSAAHAAALDQDLHCPTCPAGFEHIARGRIATCRYCGHEVILGKHGWRLDTDSTGGEACDAAPRGYHGVEQQEHRR